MKKYPVTIVLIAINVVVFGYCSETLHSVWMNDDKSIMGLLKLGANFNPYTVDGQSWRLLTSMFIHFGVLHLLVNMIGLFNGGTILEQSLGSLRFLLLYFICGAFAGLGSLFLNEFVVSAGASGALFGLYGYALIEEVLLSLNDRGQLGRVVISFVFFVIVNLLVTMAISVDIWGHVFGFIAGASLSLLHHRLNCWKESWQMIVILAVIPFFLLTVPRDQLNYYNVYRRIVEGDTRSNSVFGKNSTDAELLDSFTSLKSMWDSIHHSVKMLESVPSSVVQDTLTLGSYSALRSEEMRHRITMIERDSYIYLDSLDEVTAAMDTIARLKKPLPVDRPVVEPDTSATPPPVEYKTAKMLYDKSWKETADPQIAMYYRIGPRDSAGQWQGQVRDYYRNGAVQMRGKYKNGIKNGVFIYYSNRKTYESAGQYNNEQAVGKWEYFHWNGKLHREIAYGGETFIRTVYDSLGNVQVKDGYGKETTWYSNGTIREEGSYAEGKREGYWHGYYEDGRPMYEELYVNNQLVRGIAVDRKMKRYVYDQLSVFPMPINGMDAFKKYIVQNIRKPEFVSGRVEVIFTVGTDGSVWDINILKGVSRECDAEAIRLIKEGPAWRPGLLHGFTPIQATGYTVIDF